MKRKKKIARTPIKVCAGCRFNRHSAVLGLVSDLLTFAKLLIKILAWPCNALAKSIHYVMQLSFKRYPALHSQNVHTILCMAIGAAMLTVAFLLENRYNHPLWHATVETAKAGGVCPFYENLVPLLKIGVRDME